MYPETIIPERFRALIWMNPLTLLVGMFRNVILDGSAPNASRLAVLTGVTVIVFYGGLAFFQKTKADFPDVI
jgi:lipopolysaccharide transport system permease protein